ncbi:glutamate synthase subunit beta [Caloramator sp. E03]|uniref:glutamate synthase subunit beta n=1 Tax=Caloramator sp. E03 TaxID=2576307 RepID=UPI00111047CA|nr:glutamate synthase subunit beta [Caloramator sp. E03]QCX34580.1 glutamate synthase subunit beta [Caloramator sp. E03]
MGKLMGFKEYKRETPKKRRVEERIKDYKEIYEKLPEQTLKRQAARCMNCGTPFCNWACPLGNIAPDFNQMVYKGQWEKAYKRLSLTSPFPEITGRVCPALCEGSCTLGVNREPVTVREIELSIIERAFNEGWVKPVPPRVRTNKNVAIVGSGPAGLSAAKYLNSMGHFVTVFEKADQVGGLLRYGIPDFKLEKNVLDRRIKLMEEEGIIFKTNVEIGSNYGINRLMAEFDAILLAGGSSVPRDLNVEGRELEGVYFAVDYLTQQNKRVAGKPIDGKEIDAKDKIVIVIGGGDTGSDCIGTAIRQGAKKVYQYEILPKPPVERDETMPWPEFPRTLKVTTSHEEGCIREWCISTKRILGNNGVVTGVETVKVEWIKNSNGQMIMKEIPDSKAVHKADLVIICMGFLHPNHDGIIKDLGLELDSRGNVYTDDKYMTSKKGIFAAGDMRTGQSLVVKCIFDGKTAAKHIDRYLCEE